ncbi:hypothetical protein C5F50_08950 [Nitrosopumilus ureiphilus]|uniref:GATA-type domain-containing protein n=1 Tax=Nitrosopumilus ureiphilus TaxID=1470067 RepID=A0A7D5M5M3_9ARCH|nr:hypothetical protein C5F50_08950 [Nitrosopumilus ureiphilus]
MSCNGICHRYKNLAPVGIRRYHKGRKRCNTCGIFIIWDGLFCPCCKMQLRVQSRYRKYKEKFQEFQRI